MVFLLIFYLILLNNHDKIKIGVIMFINLIRIYSTIAVFTFVLLLSLITGCETQPDHDPASVRGQSEGVFNETGDVLVRINEGPPSVEIDFSEYQSGGGSLQEIHTVRITISSQDTGRIVFDEDWHDSAWHNGQGNQETPVSMWSLPPLPDELLEVRLEIGSNHSSAERDWFDSYLTFGPVAWDITAGKKFLTLVPFPWTDTGTLTLRATNETGIGNLNSGLGVFLSHDRGAANYHFHLQPGREYLHYGGAADRIKTGTYQITILAWKDNGWPYYGNAVWKGSITVGSESEAYVFGELSEKIAPWDMNLELTDFVLENESIVYETSFDANDPKMRGPHTHHQDQQRARFEGGTLVVSGPGNLGGGMDFDVRTGTHRIVRFRALLPKEGEFFVNLRRWGGSRMAVIFNPGNARHDPRISTFSMVEDRDLPGYHSDTPIPELNSDQWYDYTLIDTGKELFIFIDGQFTLTLPVAEELPKTGALGLEWHRPCAFDSLSVYTVDEVDVPASIERAR
jgi:hypothetical protein